MRRRGSFFAGSFASRSMIESGIFQPRSALALGENRLYAVLMAKIAYIGLGIMGAPMAGHLVRAGHDVTVFNRSMAKTRAWVEKHGGEAAVSPAQAAQEADIVISCVGTDDDLTAITLGQDGAFRTMKPGSLFIDHTTVSARIARQLFVEGESRGIFFVDAPVSGGQAGAEKGTLSIMCGGADEAVAAARLVMQSYAGRIVHVRSEEHTSELQSLMRISYAVFCLKKKKTKKKHILIVL